MGALRFRLFRFPVEIQPGFWLLALIVGFDSRRPASGLLVWVAVILVSILAHELGHAFAARAYGQEPSIVLHMLGGVTSWRVNRELGRVRKILVTLAGPTAGLVLGLGALLALFAATGAKSGAELPETPLARTLTLLAMVNVFWSLVNLLPVLPFDGGQVLAAALGPSRKKLAASVSLVFGLVAAAVLYRLGAPLGAILFALGGLSSFLSVVGDRRRATISPEMADRLAIEARRALERDDVARAAALGAAALAGASGEATRKSAFETMVWSALARGDVPAARDTLRTAGCTLDPYLEAAVAEADGDRLRALELLTAARAGGDHRVELAAMLVRVLLQAGRVAEASELALQIADQIPENELERLAREADAAGETELAKRVRETLARPPPES
jgi:Zn-dependent protease